MAIGCGVAVSDGLRQRLLGVLTYNSSYLAVGAGGRKGALGGAIDYRAGVMGIADDAAYHGQVCTAISVGAYPAPVDGPPEVAVLYPAVVALADDATATEGNPVARVMHVTFHRKVDDLGSVRYNAEKAMMSAIIFYAHPADGVSRTVERDVPP